LSLTIYFSGSCYIGNGGKIKVPGNNSTKDTLWEVQSKSEESEARLLTKEQERRKKYLAREKEISKYQQLKEVQRAEHRIGEEVKSLAREKARKASYLAREGKIAGEQESRKLKNKATLH